MSSSFTRRMKRLANAEIRREEGRKQRERLRKAADSSRGYVIAVEPATGKAERIEAARQLFERGEIAVFSAKREQCKACGPCEFCGCTPAQGYSGHTDARCMMRERQPCTCKESSCQSGENPP